MIYLIKNKKTGRFLRVSPVMLTERFPYSEDTCEYGGLELTDLDWTGPVYATTDREDAEELVKTGKNDHGKHARIDFGLKGGKPAFGLADLELVRKRQ